MLTPTEFYNKHFNRAYDIDGAYGAQCVDAFKLFTLEQYGISNYDCTNGYASGLWIYRKDKPYYEHFIEVDINDMKNGDWVFWNNGSRDCPDSHVAMYYNGKFFSQNQAGIRAFTLIDISLDGVLGVLRPKIYNTYEKQYINIPGWIDARNIYNVNTFEISGQLKPKKFGGLTYEILNFVDDLIYAEIETRDFGRCLVRITDSTPITNSPLYTHGNF